MSGPDVSTVAEMFSGLYEIVEPMPWNGLALTYRAKKDGADVVLAVLPIDAEHSPKTAALFEARARALVFLDHPRLLSVRREGIRHGVPYLELEYVDGETLDRLMATGPLEREHAVTIARRILRALELLEAVSILHLDLTPSNILVSGDDDVRVMGTGVAAILREVRDTDKTGPTGKGSGPSPGRYLAPELLIGDKLDARTDIYSVGALLHFMLTGIALGKGGPPAPADLAPIIQRATKKARQDRYRRAATMRTALEATGAPLSVMPPPLSPSKPPPLPPSEPPSEPPPLPVTLPDDVPIGVRPAAAPGRERSRSRTMLGVGGAVLIAAVIGVVVWATGTVPAAPGSEGEAGEGLQLVGAGEGSSPTASAAPSGPTETETETEAETETETETETEAEAETETETETEMGTGVETGTGSESLDLLAGVLPEPLDALWPRVSSGAELDQGERHIIGRYASANPGDPRPHILLARDFMARGWSSDAISEYRDAFAADPESRGDVKMLDDLIQLSKRETAGPAAAIAIARIYGQTVLPRVEAMLEEGELTPNERRRLNQLQRRLSSL